jgi:acyl dehydratase
MSTERFPVEEGTILLFARSVGDPNPIYHDHDYAQQSEFGAPIAPPTYVQSSAQFTAGYPLRPTLGQPWFGSGKKPTGRVPTEGGGGGGGGGGTGLHAEQHFTYHQPLVAGTVLTAESKAGERWEKEGRSGKLIFSESITEYRDQDGALIVTARSVGVLTEGPKKASN